MKHIYPDFSVSFEMYIKNKKSHSRTIFSTTLRKKYRGRWYLIRFYNEYEFKYNSRNWFSNYLETQGQFLTGVYKVMLFGKVDLKPIDPRDGTQIHELDPNQQDEYERLIYPSKKKQL